MKNKINNWTNFNLTVFKYNLTDEEIQSAFASNEIIIQMIY